MKRTMHVAATAVLLLTAGPVASARATQARVPVRSQARAVSDFNGDGFDDLAVGVPSEDVNGAVDAGAVNVIYGSSGGLTTSTNQFWTQDSPGVIGTAQAGDTFGAVLARGDFDADGFGDLAIGIPGQDVDGQVDAGAAIVLYGASLGLTSRDQAWTQDNPQIGGESEPGDLFGSAIAVGDFNADGFDDLAIGSNGEGVDPVSGAGAVNILYGFPGGLGRSNNQFWAQDVPGVLDQGEAGDGFGYSLAAGDFNGNGFDDLAIGVPFEDVGSEVDAGAVNILYGGAGGLSTVGNQFWTQNSPGILDSAESADVFGDALTTGDFNGNGFDDLAIATTFEDIGVILDSGAVNVLYGGAGGLSSTGNQFWNQDSPGVLDLAEAFDLFAYRLTSGDFANDGFDDLAIGVPDEDVNARTDSGAVNVLYGGAGGLSSTGNQFWNQDSTGIQGNSEASDILGVGLAAADFDGNGQDDLAVGVAGEGVDPVRAAGAVTLIYGSVSGLISAGNQFWAQDVPGILDQGEDSDLFGWAVA